MRQKTGEAIQETGEPWAFNGASTVRGRGVGKGLEIVPRRRPMLHQATHNALDDAIAQAQIFTKLREAARHEAHNKDI